MFPIYCTDFCSALHQEMQGYVRVSPASSNIPLTFSTGKTAPQPASGGTGTAAKK
jgi:nitrous-oxide reductase